MSITPQDVFNVAPELTNGVQQVQTLTFSSPIITGNVIAGSVGGSSFSVPFNTSNAQTLIDLTVVIAGLGRVGQCLVTGAEQITVITGPVGISLLIICSVTGGISQPTVAILQTEAPVAGPTTLTQVNNAISIATSMVNPQVWLSFTNQGITYLAAHLLSLTLLKGKTGIASQKVGDLSRSYMQQRWPHDQAYFLTAYGMQYLALRDMLVIAPLNTGFAGPIPNMPWLFPVVI